MKRIFILIALTTNLCYSQSIIKFLSKDGNNIEFEISQEDIYVQYTSILKKK